MSINNIKIITVEEPPEHEISGEKNIPVIRVKNKKPQKNETIIKCVSNRRVN